MGASATLIGAYLQPGETFTVVDLFGDSPPDEGNVEEIGRYYENLSQAAFEENYRGVHGDLPVIVRGPSTTIRERAAHGRHRFVHVDASHEYGHVARGHRDREGSCSRPTASSSSTTIARSSSRVWQRRSGPSSPRGLVPLVLSPQKVYATWGDAGAVAGRPATLAREDAMSAPSCTGSATTPCWRCTASSSARGSASSSRRSSRPVAVRARRFLRF